MNRAVFNLRFTVLAGGCDRGGVLDLMLRFDVVLVDRIRGLRGFRGFVSVLVWVGNGFGKVGSGGSRQHRG